MFAGRDLLGASDEELRRVRGAEIAMVFQDPLSSLHPFYRVGRQIAEAIQAHRDVPDEAARARTIELLELVEIPDSRRRVDAYPHELSGGMRQRAMIAMALPSGCRFHPRCPYVRERHRHTEPPLEVVEGDPEHAVACLLSAGERRRLWGELRQGRVPAPPSDRGEEP